MVFLKKNIDFMIGIIIIIFIIFSWFYVKNNVLRKDKKDIIYIEKINEEKIQELKKEIEKIIKEKDSINNLLHEKEIRITQLIESRKTVKEKIKKTEEIKTDKELKDAIYFLRNIR